MKTTSLEHARPAGRLQAWWTGNDSDPDRPNPNHRDVVRLLNRIAPGSPALDLGGTMSLNLHLPTQGLVVRVHRPFVSRVRILDEQQIRKHLHVKGVTTPIPLDIGDQPVVRCGRRWAEIEPYIEAEEPTATGASYAWLFYELGVLHRHLATFEGVVSASVAATWAPPGSLQRWLAVTLPALTDDAEALATRVVTVARHVRQSWIPPLRFPHQVIHGDARLGNLRRRLDGSTVVLDFGFANHRPRIADIAYSLAFMALARREEAITLADIALVLEAYGDGWGMRLDPEEIRVLPAYAASVMLHTIAHAGYTAAPKAVALECEPSVEVAEWFLLQGRLS